MEQAACSRRKGQLAAFRDATLFKVVYGWGLRRREAAMLDVTDFAANPAAPELGGLGVCHVRYGKAMKGSPPRRRAVATVMPWAADALAHNSASPARGFDGITHAGVIVAMSNGVAKIAQHTTNRVDSWYRWKHYAPNLSIWIFVPFKH